MADQDDIVAGERDLGGTMRLGAYPAALRRGLAGRARRTAADAVDERHRHRYEVNNAYRERARARPGLVISGTSPDGRLVEFVELPRDVHPFFVATQAHPELRSRPTRPHPLFAGARSRPRWTDGGQTGCRSSVEADAAAGRVRPRWTVDRGRRPERDRPRPSPSAAAGYRGAAGHACAPTRSQMPGGDGRDRDVRRAPRRGRRSSPSTTTSGCC